MTLQGALPLPKKTARTLWRAQAVWVTRSREFQDPLSMGRYGESVVRLDGRTPEFHGDRSAAHASWPRHQCGPLLTVKDPGDRSAPGVTSTREKPLLWSGEGDFLGFSPLFKGRLALRRATATIPQAVMDGVVERHRLAAAIRAALVPLQPRPQRRGTCLALLLLSLGPLRVIGRLLRLGSEASVSAVDLHACLSASSNMRRIRVDPHPRLTLSSESPMRASELKRAINDSSIRMARAIRSIHALHVENLNFAAQVGCDG